MTEREQRAYKLLQATTFPNAAYKLVADWLRRTGDNEDVVKIALYVERATGGLVGGGSVISLYEQRRAEAGKQL